MTSELREKLIVGAFSLRKRGLLYWNDGNDRLFVQGGGQDTAIDGDTAPGNTDTLCFKKGEGEIRKDARESRRRRDGECVNDEVWRVAA